MLQINNKSEVYQVRYDETIMELKKRISTDFNINDDNRFYLTTNTKYLYTDKTIKNSGIKHNSIIFVIYKLGFGGYLFLNIKGNIERINVSMDHTGKEITTGVKEIKNYIKQLLDTDINIIIYRDKERIVIKDMNLSLDDLGIKNSEKPLEENMIFIE